MAASVVQLLLLVVMSLGWVSTASSTAHSKKLCPFEAIYQFGDSISDTGNLIRKSPLGARSYVSRLPYGETFFRRPTGRCSNGLLMIDYFALALRLPLLNPYLERNVSFQHGANFAVAGSTALNNTFFKERNLGVEPDNTPLSVQLSWFWTLLKSTCNTHSDCAKRIERALILVGEIGGNDYNYALFQRRPIQEIRTYVPEVIGAITYGVREVIGAGAKHVIVPGNFPIGCMPVFLTIFGSNQTSSYDEMKCLRSLNEFAMFHNNHLQQAIRRLRKEFPHVVILYADYYNAFQSLLRHATSFGFENGSIMKACCGGGGEYNYFVGRMCGAPGVRACTNPAQHIHWDGLHLTQEAYRRMAEWLIHKLLTKIQCI